MGKDTKISWCDHSWNPWWGCTKVSTGCAACYAEGLATRYNTQWGPQGERRMMSDSTWREPMWWHRSALKEGKRRRVFCASMADVFEKNPQVTAARERLWELIQESTALDWLLLTKRPENIIEMINVVHPNILIVGFGLPLQEYWLMENKHRINANVMLTGGAVFDYISGNLRRGPRLLTDNGMEWLARLLIEPMRL